MSSIAIRRVVGAALLLACLMPGFGFAEDEKIGLELLGGKSKATPKPKFTTTLTPTAAKPGDEVTLSIAVELPKGFYIYSTAGKFGGRTIIETKTVGLEPLGEEFASDHEPKVDVDPDLNDKIGKFFDRVTWSRKFRVKSDAAAVSVSGELNGQYCSGPDAEISACIPIRPAYAFNLRVEIEGAGPQYARQIQPKRKVKGVEQPTPIAYHAQLSPTDAKPGDRVTLSVKATLNDGWHTFSLTQKEGGTPTVIEVPQLHGLKALEESFHTDQPFEVKVEEGKTLEIYHNEVTWQQDFEVLPDVKPGQYGAALQIVGQYCDASTCTLVKGKTELGQLSRSEEGDAAVPVPAAPAVPAAPMPAVPDPLLPFLLVCFGGGFLALLTPCSFPMVPITVSFFLKQSETQHKPPVFLALIYCGTIVAAFTILGVGIAVIFGAAQLTQLANISWLNYIIGAVFVLFAFNMLGMFEIHMPGWLLTVTASKESAGSYLGAVFMALTFTLTSFTCTFAIAGSLLVLASKGEVYRPVVGMLAFGTAFAAPFFILAMIPGLLKKLPKSGGWMNSVKVVMGLIELGAAVKFFSIADPGQVLFDHITVMTIWFIIALVTAVYLFGWFRLPHDSSSESISPIRMLLGISFLVLAGMLLTGVAMPDRGGTVVRQILAFAPMRVETGNGPLGPTINHHGLEFALYFDKALPIAKQENRPLLLDFTGVNCPNCRNMELKMNQASWKNRIEKYIGVQLYVDVPEIPGISNRTEGLRLMNSNIALQEELLQDSTMPLYAVVTPDGKHVLTSYRGKEIVPGTFVQFLDEGWTKWEQLQGKGGQAIGKLTDRKEPPFPQ